MLAAFIFAPSILSAIPVIFSGASLLVSGQFDFFGATGLLLIAAYGMALWTPLFAIAGLLGLLIFRRSRAAPWMWILLFAVTSGVGGGAGAMTWAPRAPYFAATAGPADFLIVAILTALCGAIGGWVFWAVATRRGATTAEFDWPPRTSAR